MTPQKDVVKANYNKEIPMLNKGAVKVNVELQFVMLFFTYFYI